MGSLHGLFLFISSFARRMGAVICVVIQGPCRPSSMSLAGSRFDGGGLLAADLQHAASLEKVLKKSFTCFDNTLLLILALRRSQLGRLAQGRALPDTVGSQVQILYRPPRMTRPRRFPSRSFFIVESLCRQCRGGHGPRASPRLDRVTAKTQHLGLMEGCAVHLHAYGI